MERLGAFTPNTSEKDYFVMSLAEQLQLGDGRCDGVGKAMGKGEGGFPRGDFD